VRPGVVEDAGDAVEVVDAQAGLQGVVAGLGGRLFLVDVEGAVGIVAEVPAGGVVGGDAAGAAVWEAGGSGGRGSSLGKGDIGCGDGGLAGLVDVAKAEQVATDGADVADLKEHV